MDTGKIRLITLGVALAGAVLMESLALALVIGEFCGPLAATLAARTGQAFLMLTTVAVFQGSSADVGLGKTNRWAGIKTGLSWSLVFGGVVAMAFTFLAASGVNPLQFFYLRLDGGDSVLVLFFVTGAVAAPFTEELFFRGLLYGFFRRWGVVAGIILTTFIFSVFHLGDATLPVTQVIGGIVFCLAYERTKSLWTPYVIHGLGNAVIFILGLIPDVP